METTHLECETDSRVKTSFQTPSNHDLAAHDRLVRILHVDDGRCILEVSKEILETEADFVGDTASSVHEAKEKMSRAKNTLR
jgi:hypothetical protein